MTTPSTRVELAGIELGATFHFVADRKTIARESRHAEEA